MLVGLIGITIYPLVMALSIKNIGILEIKKKEILLYYLFFCISSNLEQYLVDFEYPLIYVMLIVFLLLWVIHKHFIKSLVVTLLSSVLFIISDAMASMLILLIFRANVYNSTELIMVIQLISFSIMNYLLSKLIERVLKKVKDSIFNSKIMYFICFHIGMLFVIIYMNHMTTTYLGFKTDSSYVMLSGILYIVYFITSLILFLIIIKYLSKENEMKNEKMLFDANKKYIQAIEESRTNLRKIKHDYNNIITSLKIYIDEDNIDGLKKYYYNDLNNLNIILLNEDQILAQLQNIKISEIKSILLYKTSLAYESGIKLSIEARDEISEVAISTAILSQIIGILLDNAIEATNEIENKEIIMAIIKNENSITFIFQNTYKPTDYSISRFFEYGFSTKSSGRGIGLATVRDYLNKFGNLYLETEKTDMYVTQTLIIKNGI